MKIEQIMTRNPEFCTPDTSLEEVARMMREQDVGLIPVCESRDTRRLVGCITDRDIVVRVIADGKEPGEIDDLRRIMSTDLRTCGPEDDVAAAEAIMKQHQLRRVLICDKDGALVGIVAQADIARSVSEIEVGETVEAISQPSKK